jgi:hypothetical protein
MLIAKEHHEKSLAESEDESAEDIDLVPEVALSHDGDGHRRWQAE